MWKTLSINGALMDNKRSGQAAGALTAAQAIRQLQPVVRGL